MKSYKNEMRAFSLAEALITLLIVCLITLASIPVITKKKRNVNTAVNGAWMCTKNTNGEYVIWSSIDPSGDIKDPDTWKKSNTQDKCVFLPPLNAKNYVVTMVGGGGGGRDGVSEQVDYLDADRRSITVKEDGIYRLAVVGGGGGGHGSDDSGDGCNGIGGQGGGGAVWIGSIKLFKEDSLTSVIGFGASGCTDGGKKAQWCNRGGTSSIDINGENFISAGGGGGQSTKDGNRPKRGYGGDGGTLQVNYKKFNNIIQNSPAPISSDGHYAVQFCNCCNISGAGGSCGSLYPNTLKYVYSSYDGKLTGQTELIVKDHFGYTNADHKVCIGIHNGHFLGDFYNGSDNYEYGLGGLGCRFKNSTGFNGNDGIVKLWQVIQKPGKGGSAATPVYYSIPTIKGKAEITIGNGGDANSDGEISILKVINNKNQEERIYKSNFGLAGVLGEPSSEKYTTGGIGEHSGVTEIGGGDGGICHAAYYETVTQTRTYPSLVIDEESGEPKCSLAVYDMGPTIKAETPQDGVGSSCPLDATTPIKGLCMACYAGDDTAEKCAYQMSNITGQWEPSGTLAKRGRTAFDDKFNNPLNSSESYESLFNFIKDRNSSHGLYAFKTGEWDVEKSKNLPGHMEPKDTNFECIQYETKTTTITITTPKFVPAGCEKALDGKYFGAGGGGGGTSNQKGVFGEGGKGAYGGVVIEW